MNAVDQGLHMKVMTYNIRHGRGLDGKVNLDRIAADIRRAQADIVGLQEVDRFNIRSGFKDQVQQLAEKTGMSWSYSPSVTWGFAQYGNAVLSRYPIVSNEVYSLPGIVEKRSLMKTVVQTGEHQVTVLNTHLGVSVKEREKQIPIVADILKDVEGPSILMGDFNMESDHKLMEQTFGEWSKVKLKQKSATVLSGHEIDHIFVNLAAPVQTAWTMTSDGSDHNPVVGEWKWAVGPRIALAVNE